MPHDLLRTEDLTSWNGPVVDYPPKPEPALRGRTNTELHKGVYKLFAGIFGAILAVFFVTFRHDTEATLMIVICGVYGAMYFGTPYLLWRTSGKAASQHRWADFLNEPFATNTGEISGRGALFHICLVPAALSVAVSCICLAVTLYR